MLTGAKILITGATGQVARPVADALATGNEVWALGRFGDPAVEADLVARGVRTWRWDMGNDSLDGVPDDFTHVLHSAVVRGEGSDFDETVELNVAATGQLMTHCRQASAFLFVSTGAIYRRLARDHRHTETDPLGGLADWLPTYPIGKLSTEGVVRALARTLDLPTVIARLNVAYGPYGHGGVPVLFFRRMLAGQPIEIPREGQNWCSPIHTDDVARQVPLLWSAATVPATVVNWGGDDAVGIEEMMTFVAERTGTPVTFTPSDVTRDTYIYDNSRREALIGSCEVPWREGVLRTIGRHVPEALASEPRPAGMVSRVDSGGSATGGTEGDAAGNAARVRAAYAAFRDRNVDGVLSHFAPDIAWTHPDGLLPYGLGGTEHGHAGVRAFIARVPEVFAELRPEPREIIAVGDRVVAFGTHYMTARSGRTCTVPFVHSWVFVDGQATRFEDLFDTAAVRAVLDGAGTPPAHDVPPIPSVPPASPTAHPVEAHQHPVG